MMQVQYEGLLGSAGMDKPSGLMRVHMCSGS
jgi:hypothetical protein